MRKCHIDEFYVWRTQKDAKVRSKHAERDGKVYSVRNPPPDGPPGTAPNCRCWKESPTLKEIRSGEVPCYYSDLNSDRIRVGDELAALQNSASGIKTEEALLKSEIGMLEEVLAKISDPEIPIYIPSIPKIWLEWIVEALNVANFAYKYKQYETIIEMKSDLRSDIAAKKTRLRAITPRVEAVNKEIETLSKELNRIIESMKPCEDCQFAR